MKKLGFIGGGNMAEALARGLVEHKIFKPAELIVSDVDAGRRRKINRGLKIAVTDDNLEVVREARAILLAVKPQQIDEVLTGIAAEKIRLAEKLFISIAAGITIARLSGALGAKARVIRVMPNAPAMVGRGMAALVRSKGATKADEAFALKIFQAVGDAVALTNESLLDPGHRALRQRSRLRLPVREGARRCRRQRGNSARPRDSDGAQDGRGRRVQHADVEARASRVDSDCRVAAAAPPRPRSSDSPPRAFLISWLPLSMQPRIARANWAATFRRSISWGLGQYS